MTNLTLQGNAIYKSTAPILIALYIATKCSCMFRIIITIKKSVNVRITQQVCVCVRFL